MSRHLPIISLLVASLFVVSAVPGVAAAPGPDEWIPHCIPGDLECGWTPPTVNDVYGWAKGTLQRLVPDCTPGDLECPWPQ